MQGPWALEDPVLTPLLCLMRICIGFQQAKHRRSAMKPPAPSLPHPPFPCSVAGAVQVVVATTSSKRPSRDSDISPCRAKRRSLSYPAQVCNKSRKSAKLIACILIAYRPA